MAGSASSSAVASSSGSLWGGESRHYNLNTLNILSCAVLCDLGQGDGQQLGVRLRERGGERVGARAGERNSEQLRRHAARQCRGQQLNLGQ